MGPNPAQGSRDESQAHGLRADAGERRVQDPHRETHGRDGNASGYGSQLRQANDCRERGRGHAENKPSRPASRELGQQGSGKRAAHEEQDRQRRRRRRAKRALAGLVACLSSVPAHERYVDAVGDDAVGVDEAGDHGETRSQPCLSLRGGSLRPRRAIGSLSFEARRTCRRRGLCHVFVEPVSKSRTSS